MIFLIKIAQPPESGGHPLSGFWEAGGLTCTGKVANHVINQLLKTYLSTANNVLPIRGALFKTNIYGASPLPDSPR